MTDTIKIAELINLLRTFIGDTQIVRAAREAADLIEQKDARIAELEAVEPIAWYVPDDHGNVYMTTGYSHEAAQWKQIYKEVRPLYAAPVADSATTSDGED